MSKWVDQKDYISRGLSMKISSTPDRIVVHTSRKTKRKKKPGKKNKYEKYVIKSRQVILSF